MSNVKITAKLPEDEAHNSLQSVYEASLMAPLEAITAVVLLGVDKITRDVRTGTSVVQYRIARLETLGGDDAAAANDLAAQALEDRLGVVRLPFDIVPDLAGDDSDESALSYE